MSMQAENPRAVAGSNEAPDYAKRVTDDMKRDYEAYDRSVTELLEKARAAPTEVNDDETAGVLSKIVKDLRDAVARGEAFRVKEKEPYLRGGNAVDQYFGALMMKCERQKKTDKAGAADVLHARVHDWNERKLAIETAKRLAVEKAARDEEERLATIRRQEEQKAADAKAAAERARKPEKKAELAQVAAAAEQTAKETRLQEDQARAATQDAKAASTARPADMVRTRSDDGVLNTMAKVPYVEIVDPMKLDASLLWAFVKDEHKLQALKAWAKITQHKRAMDGAIIEMRNDTVIR